MEKNVKKNVCICITYHKWASLVAQSVKNLPAVQETQVQSLGWEDPLKKKMATHCSILAWTILFFFFFNWKQITLQYCSGFCHTLTWISHGCTYVPHPEPPFHLPPHTIPLGHPSASAQSTLSHALNLDWQSVSHMIIYMFQWYSLKSSHPCLLPQSPKDCSIHLCLFCCLAYRVIVTVFLNSIYMR